MPPIRAALNSLGFAGLTVLFSLLMGFPAASALARPGRLERWLDPLLMLPLGASAVTLGLGFHYLVQPATLAFAGVALVDPAGAYHSGVALCHTDAAARAGFHPGALAGCSLFVRRFAFSYLVDRGLADHLARIAGGGDLCVHGLVG